MVETRRKLLLETGERAKRLAQKHRESGSSQRVIAHYEKEAEVCERELYKDIYESAYDSGDFWGDRNHIFMSNPFDALCLQTKGLTFWVLSHLPTIVQKVLKKFWNLLNWLWEKLPLVGRCSRWDYLRWLAYVCCVWTWWEMYVMLMVPPSFWVGVAASGEWIFAWLILLDEGMRIEVIHREKEWIYVKDIKTDEEEIRIERTHPKEEWEFAKHVPHYVP